MSMVFGYAQNRDSLFSTDTLQQAEGVKTQKLDNQRVYLFEIHDEIGPGATRITQSAIEEAIQQNVDFLVLDLNTYQCHTYSSCSFAIHHTF